MDQLFAERYFEHPGRLIDLGCGTGRFSVPFAQRGFCVVAVDLSEEMLKQTLARANRGETTVHCIKANLVELESIRNEGFDYAACLFSTLGMIQGVANRQRVVDHAYRLLRPRGRFVLHVHNRWFNVWHSQGRRWLVKNLFQDIFGTNEAGTILMPVHQGIAGLSLHLFTRREVRRIVQRAGFHIHEVRPVSLREDGRLPYPCWLRGLRSHGYLVAAERPRA